MKKIISMIGIAGSLCLFPCCKKSDNKPDVPGSGSPNTQQNMTAVKNASLYVSLDSKACAVPQSEYTSATVDFRTIKVFNTEFGWEDLTAVPGAWDVVSLQTAPVPVAELTEISPVHSGTITKIKLIVGDNNQLVVNDQAARCYNISTHEIILDLEGEIEVGSLSRIVVSIDICGNITVEPRYNDEPCYTLKPVMKFESFTKLESVADNSSDL
jgi:hypothetical protein